MELLEKFIKIFNPIKNVFSLYILMYILPMFIPISIFISIKKSIIVNNVLNVPVAILIGLCSLIGFMWTIFFLHYFTKQRNSNPALYEPGFMSGFTVAGGQHEQ